MTWAHERVEPERLATLQFHEIPRIRELPALLRGLTHDPGRNAGVDGRMAGRLPHGEPKP